MNCLEFQGLMIQYINDELSYKEKEGFMEHLAVCENCKEELEVYYIILTGMKQMDRSEPLSNDFHKEFLARLEETRRDLAWRHRARIGRRIAFPMIVGAAVFLTGLSVAGDSQESADGGQESSVYEMKFRFSEEERHRMFQKNVTEQIIRELMERTE